MTSISIDGPNFGLQVGHNSGNISAVFHTPPDREKTPPSPSSTVPFDRDPDFVDRPEILKQIHESISKPGARIGLSGLGGVGKSQLAIETSYRHRLQNPDIWIFWVYAGSVSRFEQSFEEIATRAGIRRQRDPEANIYELVEAWLNGEKSGKWVLVLDNVDDDRFLRERPAPDPKRQNRPNKPLLNYIPKTSRGSILVTGRNEGAVVKIVGRRNLIQIKHLPESEALELLNKKLILPQDQTETSNLECSKRLVKELEFLPLAIAQAAAFITYFSPRYSVSQYLEKFLNNDRGAIMLLEHELHEKDSLNRDWEAENSIGMTWQISFDHIARVRPSAADLLSLMCFFDRNEIPECVLFLPPKSTSEEKGLQSDSKKRSHSEMEDLEQEFVADVAILRDFAFVTIVHSRSFTMHRLVQLITQAWLKKQLGKFDFYYTQFINNLRREFPRRFRTPEDLAKGRVLSPSIFQIHSFAVDRRRSSAFGSPKITSGEYHLLSMAVFYEKQAREKAILDFLNDEMVLHTQRLCDRMAEVTPHLASDSREMLLHNMQSLTTENKVDITRRFSELAISEERLDGVENMLHRLDESGQNLTLDFTKELATGLEKLKEISSVSDVNPAIDQTRRILRACEEIDNKFAQLFGFRTLP
ncbi:hypothetical protein N7472_010578 [Penicillium cf. griseofulvum]|uniref:NB-ARC domain-containing protein n=1 Tax=Penicillium cf. griseofulvum TaxID=2972120 RepID=A0A9W9M1P8_9EURO|nr:hypothetical protein N7472_010578 [Penicillium cf. griseofulvum]KAJ5436842.1 hypothetical protein N7445_007727 [Penicillium cf. griseofulvum]